MHLPTSSERSSVFTTLWPVACLLVAAVGLILATAAYRGPLLAPANTVPLPIEVLGADGHVESVTVHVSSPGSADRLYVKGHKLGYHKSDYAQSNGYDGKASFRINGGAWVPISNATFNAFSPERRYYSGPLSGPIGGPWPVLRGTLPIDATGALVAGANTIEFRFNQTEGISSGYRILDLDVQTGSGTSVVGQTTFVDADPDAWSAPFGSSSAIQEGADLWSARNILTEGPNGESIVASCADCHARDGRDLKYFNFSNKSIVARAEFHGLSADQGRKIASYIRTRSVDLPSGYTIADAGRPWNPPYQPGPGLKNQPVELWAAGAGMEWVLDEDMDMYPLLFPSPGDRQMLQTLDAVPDDADAFLASLDGTRAPNQMLTRTHVDSTLNVDELPISMPLPDIYEWWPDVHPVDFLPGGESAYASSNVVAGYENWRSEMAQGESNINALVQETSEFVGPANTSYDGQGIVHLAEKFTRPWYDVDWNWPSGWYSQVNDEKLRQKLSFEQWRAIKTWEIMHEFGLEDRGDEIFRNNPQGIRAGGRDRTWWIEISLYDVAPHKNGKPGYPSYGAYASVCQNLYFSSSWYEIAAILNTGNRLGDGNSPYDWNYHHPHIGDHVNCYGTNQALRYVKAQIVAQQQRGGVETNEHVANGDGWGDWHAHMPERIAANGGKAVHMRSLPNDLRFDIAEAVTTAHMLETLKYNPDAFPRGSGDDLETKSYTPQVANEIGLGYPNHPDAFITMTKQYADNDVSPLLVNRMARFGEALWPNANWEQWMLPDAVGQVELRDGWNFISSNVAASDSDLDALFSGFRDQVNVMKDEDGRSYVPGYGIDDIGTWNNADGYLIEVDGDHTLTFDGYELPAPDTPIELRKGWNYVSFLPQSAMSPADAFASISSSVEIVKDFSDNIYMPGETNTIGSLQPGAAYKVYTNSDVTFTYPSSSNTSAPTNPSSLSGSGLAVPKQARNGATPTSIVVQADGLPEGTRVLALDADGREVGASTVSDGQAVVTVWSDDPTTSAVDGPTSGDALQVAYETAEGTQQALTATEVRRVPASTASEAIAFASDAVYVLNSDEEAVTEFRLATNFPNPVEDATTIAFDVPAAEHVRIELFNTLGQRVAVLVDETKPPGTHEVDLDASSLGSGVYFYRMTAGDFKKTEKMTIVK